VTGLLQSGQTGHLDKSIGTGPPPVHDSGHRISVKVHFRFILIWYNELMYGFVTDSPLFDNPGGFYRALTNEEDIRLRASAQRAMEAGRPMTVAEMYGKPQQLFRKLGGFGAELSKEDKLLRSKKILMLAVGAFIIGGVGLFLIRDQ